MRNSRSALILAVVVVALSSSQSSADDHGSPWKSSRFYRTVDGNGRTIPCRCLLNGQTVPLGTTVCMGTYAGVQIARCDLSQNVMTWVPTGVPCEVSTLPPPPRTNG